MKTPAELRSAAGECEDYFFTEEKTASVAW